MRNKDPAYLLMADEDVHDVYASFDIAGDLQGLLQLLAQAIQTSSGEESSEEEEEDESGSSTDGDYTVDWLLCTEGDLHDGGWQLRGTEPLVPPPYREPPPYPGYPPPYRGPQQEEGVDQQQQPVQPEEAEGPAEESQDPPVTYDELGAAPGEYICNVCHGTLTGFEVACNGLVDPEEKLGTCNNCCYGLSLMDLWTN
ncbi:E7 [Duck papillomavirus 3]|uniref:E7 n=1 Tax=Duck papillomavirus 3 TaxID=2562546 RepID=A0AAE5YN81_9PAPI|nr:E7 [Duck papillomavirus 3]